MSFKSSYIYIFILLTLIVVLRENFNFTLGDREAYFNYEGWEADDAFRNRLTAYIFSNLKYFGEILFCTLYYKNVFKLSSLLLLSTKIKAYFNSRLVYYSILLCLFAPVTIIFTSFAGKDIISIFLASDLCIDLLEFKYYKKTYKISVFKILKFTFYTILLIILRKISAILFLILIPILFIIINKNRFKNLPLIILPILIFLIISNWDEIYELFYQEFFYQWNASITSGDPTFSPTNKAFTLQDFFLNSYQMFTSVALIHFSQSFFKASLLLFNSFVTYIITIFLSLIYFFKNLKIQNLFIFKALFLLIYFIMNGFLSQNNPGGAVRYMASAVPIYTTFIFAILPE